MDARGSRGVTYLELVATATIVLILASAVLPLGRVAVKRQREIELRRALREMRGRHRPLPAGGGAGPDRRHRRQGRQRGLPEDLEKLVKGVQRVGALDRKLKFLRRIPVDPMTNTAEWGLRCYQDDPDSTSWCGDNVYDVYSKSTAKALDGTTYNTW